MGRQSKDARKRSRLFIVGAIGKGIRIRFSVGEPVTRLEKPSVELSLGSVGFRLRIIIPTHQRRKGHEYGLDTPARFEAEAGASVIEEVELDVAPTAVELKGSLGFTVRMVFTSGDDGLIGWDEVVADTTHEAKAVMNPRSLTSSKKRPPIPRASRRWAL